MEQAVGIVEMKLVGETGSSSPSTSISKSSSGASRLTGGLIVFGLELPEDEMLLLFCWDFKI